MERDPDGGYTSARLGLRLALRPTQIQGEPVPMLRWLTLDGTLVVDSDEAADLAELRAEAERQRAEAERQRAHTEHQRAEVLAAKLRALGLDPEV